MNLNNAVRHGRECPGWAGGNAVNLLGSGLYPSPDMILDSISDVVEIVDPRGVIIYSNLSPAYMRLLGQDQVLGRPCREVYEEVCVSCGECPMDEVFITGKRAAREGRMSHKNGQISWMRQRLYPMFNDKGWVSAVLRLVFDITSDKKKELAEAKYLDSLEQSLHNRIQESAPVVVQALSAREMEILALVAEGMSNREIARVFGISAHTVKTHVVHILNKLCAKDRTQAAVTAARMKII